MSEAVGSFVEIAAALAVKVPVAMLCKAHKQLVEYAALQLQYQ